MKLLATADLHIKNPEDAALLERILHCAEQETCGAILIAGDLLDNPYPDRETARRLVELFSAPGCPIFLAAGNHDPLEETALYRQLPSRVKVFPAEGGSCPLEGLTLVGRSSPKQFNDASPLAGLKAPGGLSVGVFHGQFGGGDFQPVSAEELAESGFSLVLLGHIHKAESRQWGGCRLLVPGTPQGRGWDETGEKYAWILETDAQGGIDVTPLPVADRILKEYELELSDCTTAAEITERLEGLEIPETAQLGKTTVRVEARLVLTGCLPLDPAPMAESYKARHGREVKNTCRIGLRPTDPALLKEQNTLQGAFLRRALAELEAAPAELRPALERAMELGLQALKEGDK